MGPGGVKAALQNLSAAASEVANTAAGEFAPQTQDLNEAISSLGSTIEGLQDQADLRAKFGAIATAAREVEQAMTPILDKARTACPSGSTRPTT
ncbi:hypothetical protein GCM10023320_01650 [Pseudonocardia adelaidensis]|uniref:Uncharacterized protein n=1 Tax=Pseudonocardia adelaidensis TaxID=648754 RepID=A0ABP9N7S8_9PSEU